MTAPVAAEPTLDTIPDDFDLAGALHASAEARSHLFAPDAPEPSPVDAPPAPEAPKADPPTDPAKQPDAPPVEGEPDVAVDPLAADPFAALVKDAKPLAYRMNGAEYAHDTILEVPGKGAVIPADKLDAFRNYVARAESNTEAVKTLLGEREQYERVGGLEKVYQTQEQFAAINEVGLILLEAIRNPLSLVTIDAQNNVVPHAERIQILQERMKVASERAVYDTRKTRSDTEQTFRTTAQQQSQVADAIPRTIDAHFTQFSEADRQAAKAYFGKRPDLYTFTVTAANANEYGQPVGTLMVHGDVIKDWLTDRQASRPVTPPVDKAKVEAAKFNAAATPKPTPKPKAQAQPRDGEGKFVEGKRKERPDASTIFERALGGKPVSGADSYEDLT